jgi:hypothetical protein
MSKSEELTTKLDGLGWEYQPGGDRSDAHKAVKRSTPHDEQACASTDGLLEAVQTREAQLVVEGKRRAKLDEGILADQRRQQGLQ